MPGHPPATGVGKTALAIALIRAEETRRPDRLFDDPFASAFLDAAPEVFAEELRAARHTPVTDWGLAYRYSVTLRTRFYDDYLLEATADGIEQVVLLAAGLDCRAYRLDWPAGICLFELDLPDVLRFKNQVLTDCGASARCRRTVVASDLLGGWDADLRAAGFAPELPTAWLVEGLLIYLSAEEAEALLSTVTELAGPGSRLSFGYEAFGSAVKRAQAKQLPSVSEYAPLWKGGLGDTAGWLSAHGWSCHRHERAELAERYRRAEPARTPDDSAGGADDRKSVGSGGFVVAVKS